MANQKIPELLRPLGPLGTFIATAVTIITTNWILVVSVVIGLVAALWSSALWFFQLPAVQIGISIFLAVLWTTIGITILIDRRKPRLVRSFPDYRYGLTPEGIVPNIDVLFEDTWLGFAIQIRNYSQAPIRYTIEQFEVRIESRILPKIREGGISGYLPRGGGKQVFAGYFKKAHVTEFFGKRVTGTAEIQITYGHPEEIPARRLRIKGNITLHLSEDGAPPITAYGVDVIEEIDEPIAIS